MFPLFVIKNAAVNICGQIFVWTDILISLGYKPESRITLTWTNNLIFSGTAKLFSKDAALYIPTSQCKRVPTSPYPHQYLIIVLIIAISGYGVVSHFAFLKNNFNLFLGILGLCGCLGFSLAVSTGGCSSLSQASRCSGFSCFVRGVSSRAGGL